MGDPVIIPSSVTGAQIAARVGADRIAALEMQRAPQQVAMHEQALQPHGGRFPERAEVRLIAGQEAASRMQRPNPQLITEDQVRLIASREAAAAARMSRIDPQLITGDQAILSAQFFGV